MFSGQKSRGLLVFDLFNKTDKKDLQQSGFGGIITWIGLFFLILLLSNELRTFWTVKLVQVISVDSSGVDNMPVFIDIAFPAVTCSNLNLGLVDQMGNEPKATDRYLKFLPYDPNSPDLYFCKSCGNKPSSQDPTCCSCDEIRNGKAQLRSEDNYLSCHIDTNGNFPGCRVVGSFSIAKMKGTLQFSSRSSDFIPSFFGQEKKNDHKPIDLSHRITTFSFGPLFPSMINPLEGYKEVHTTGSRQVYSIQLVPTEYPLSGSILSTNQYSVTNFTQPLSKDGFEVPSVFFSWEFSPMLISLVVSSTSFLHLLTRICAVVGGSWVVLGLVYSTIAAVPRAFQKQK